MNRLYYLLLAVLVLFLTSCNEGGVKLLDNEEYSEVSATNGDDLSLPEVIQGLPLKILVEHDPDTIYAQLHDKDTSRYIWKHATTVKTLESNIQIIEFGTYNFKGGKWILGNFTKKPFTAKEFESWYFKKSKQDFISWENCTDAYLLEGQEYVDPSNWSITQDELIERNGLWYYIGIDDNGEKVAGYCRYYAAAELRQ